MLPAPITWAWFLPAQLAGHSGVPLNPSRKRLPLSWITESERSWGSLCSLPRGRGPVGARSDWSWGISHPRGR